MSNSTVAKRYAIALFELAKEHKIIEQVEEELRVVQRVFEKELNLMTILKSPKLPINKKKEILKIAFANVNPFVLNTLMILVERHREDQITSVVYHFIELAHDKKGIAEAIAYSARPLTDEELKALSAAFAKKVGKKALLINNVVDSQLLGGVKLQIGNRIFDGSVRGKIERLERQLLG
ncbi:F0F1 ATP synthase subunit delta [Bacillus aquiflavi]|uniref:ATP synthase subunit delta n=1 Tax=Bacillus aquiflavi TaxID=2672567 RepID=A0A6B3VXI3_9BACI|nr:F0F1 ATP synthase subunit delta [Bacillus aquiflavi]MBA4536639.1 F0F1 ATP synthase subunit delta [Bacillus aquiflavi]NEY81007.1 F0F1 ATP synthase subunit delta [Bacillus aquiflavi]UAC47922.1 F0F1 ATP synthase subunit delta [Bacillus aquiflavi]